MKSSVQYNLDQIRENIPKKITTEWNEKIIIIKKILDDTKNV